MASRNSRATHEKSDSTEALQFLLGTEIRQEILEALGDEPMTGRGLRDTLDAPRATVYQNIQQLLERDWIEETASGYRTTRVGDAFYATFTRWNTTFETVRDLAPFLEHVPLEELDIDALADSQIDTPPHRPGGVFDTAYQRLQTADTAYVVGEHLHERFVQLALDRILEDSFELVGVFPASELSVLQSHYTEDVRAGMTEGRLTLYEYDEDVYFTNAIIDESVLLAVHDPNGFLRVAIEPTASGALDWARQRFEATKADSRAMTPADFE